MTAAHDVIVIGGGPAGLSCAIYTSRARLSTVVLDRAPGAGALANSTKIANYPGVLGPVAGEQLLDAMRRQALAFGAEYCRTTVAALDLASNPKAIYATDGTYRGRAIVIATGSMGRKEKIEGEEEFTGRGVSYCATCDAAFYEDKVAAVVGDDETAMEESLFLARFARTVHLLCPKSRLSGPESLLEEIERTAGITTHLQTKARRVVGEQTVTGIVVKVGRSPEETMPVDGIFMLLSGTAPITEFLGGAAKAQVRTAVSK